MQVSASSWHVRVYRWWYDHKYKRDSWETPKTHSNLCPYMRAVMFWAPLRALFWDWITVCRIGSLRIPLNLIVITTLAYGLPQPLGYLSYKLKIAMWIVTLLSSAICLLTVTILWICFAISDWKADRRAARYRIPWEERMQMEREELAKRQLRQKRWAWLFNSLGKFLGGLSEFGSLIRAYLRSGHDRICPEVQFIDETKPSSN